MNKKCSFCDKSAVYFRKYSGEKLCKKCFCSSIVEKTRKTISKYNMLKYGDKIAIAVSGGKDSLSLLSVLKEICTPHSAELHAILIDEGIEDYRDEAIDITKDIVKKYNIPLSVVSYKELYDTTLDNALDWKNKRNISSCAICGPFRRRAIDVAAKKIGATVIATGHNLDDYLQTYLINICNGDLDKITWLNPKNMYNDNIRRVKPFLEISEHEITLYAYFSKLPFQTSTCPYMNEGIRSQIREFVKNLEQQHPGIQYSMLKSAISMSQNTPATSKTRLSCKKCGNISSSEICSVCNTLNLIKINK